MLRLNRTAERLLLLRRWREWSAIVASLAERRGGVHGMDPTAYRALYREVLRAAAALEAESVGAERELYRRLQEIVRPWLSLESLAQADLQILLSVLQEVRQTGKQLGVARRFPWLLWLLTLALGAMVVAGVLVLAGNASKPLWAWWRQLLAWVAFVRAALVSLTDLEKIGLVCIALVCVALIVVWRARTRS